MSRHNGFTLIELVMALAIIGLLLAIAIPAYRSYILRGQRAEAYEVLLAVEQRQQRYYLFNSSYSSSTSTLGLGTQSTNGRYTIAISSATTTGYIATATASGTQTSDTSCLNIQLSIVASSVSYTPQSCWGQ